MISMLVHYTIGLAGVSALILFVYKNPPLELCVWIFLVYTVSCGFGAVLAILDTFFDY